MITRTLVAIPALNEEPRLNSVAKKLDSVRREIFPQWPFDVLIVDDGSTDGTARIAQTFQWALVKHSSTLGYGAGLCSAFGYALDHGYQHVVTMDADGQHPAWVIPRFLGGDERGQVVSGSRYLPNSERLSPPPAAGVNRFLTALVNGLFGTSITDVGCGLKRIDVSIVRGWTPRETGYLFPLEFWVRCARSGYSIEEVPVPMIYLDPSRNHQRKFGTIELLIDRAVYCLLRAMHDLPNCYVAGYGDTVDIDLRNGSKTLCLTLETLLSFLSKESNCSVPVQLASRNLRALHARIRK